ncbi:MAG: NAD(P)H-dependent glycerol-3-phosphate dehydrogenase [Cyanobacteria bacterium REEB459]|nr:NAD(P)H-dependent glycerol-3-phosphate dehydrogenase [Cyanobacteria bacterium REEB459]
MGVPSPVPVALNQVFETYKHNQVTLTILGSGVWGQTLAGLALANQHQVRLWSRRQGLTLEQAVAGADLVISAVSMAGVPDLAKELEALAIAPTTILVTATKGLDPATTLTPSQIFQQTFPGHALVVLSGPNLAGEIQQGLPAATVIASRQETAAEALQHVLATETFRTYRSGDPLGAELGGTLKNVMAIAVGVCDGLKLGANARSALITRALPELIRIGTHLGGQAETFLGLSGLGDMLATCTSALSRNYRVGYGLAQGKALEQILRELGSTAEGVNTAQVVMAIARRDTLSLPICDQVDRLLRGQISASAAVTALMERQLKAEDYQQLLRVG